MTSVVTASCIRCKYIDCVEVCPVDCFYAGENMLVIHPEECIDCGVSDPECPAVAIVPDRDETAAAWVELNCTYAQQWANFTREDRPLLMWTHGKVCQESEPTSAPYRMA